MELHFTFYAIAAAVIKLLILMFIGYMLYRLKLFDDRFTDTLSLLIVRVAFPALIIAKTTTYFSFTQYAWWWTLPLCAIVFSLAGMSMGWIAKKCFTGATAGTKEVMCSCGFQNCGYLPMNLILFSFTGALADRLLIYMFLFIIGFNILMWSLVPLFLSGKLRRDFNVRVLLNPPVVATIFSLLWVALAGKGSMPPVILGALEQLGQTAVPLSMLMLGAYLCRYQGYRPENPGLLTTCAAVKLLLFPALVLPVLAFAPISYDYKFFLFLESIMPTAASLVIIGSYAGGDNKFFSASIFYTHVAAIFSIPLWLAVFKLLVKI